MKKFIAALLSAMVGIFGYTITDVTVDERIATLEAEVAELREENTSDNSSSGSAGNLEIGDYLKLSTTSNSKFLFRENENGELEYISPQSVDEIKEDDLFVYVTDTVCQVTGFETITHTIDYGINYEPSSISLEVAKVSFSLNGSAPPELAGKQIIFDFNLVNSSSVLSNPYEDVTCLIASDGSFSFNGELAISPSFSDLMDNVMDIYHFLDKEYLETTFNTAFLVTDSFTISTPTIS